MPGHPRVLPWFLAGPKLHITSTRALALLPHRPPDNSSKLGKRCPGGSSVQPSHGRPSGSRTRSPC